MCRQVGCVSQAHWTGGEKEELKVTWGRRVVLLFTEAGSVEREELIWGKVFNVQGLVKPSGRYPGAIWREGAGLDMGC